MYVYDYTLFICMTVVHCLQVPFLCPLQGTVHLRLKCVMESNVENKGFLVCVLILLTKMNCQISSLKYMYTCTLTITVYLVVRSNDMY